MKGGLVTAHHNDLHDGVANLTGKAITPTHMRDYPKIFTGCAMRGGKPKDNVTGSLPKDVEELKGDILI